MAHYFVRLNTTQLRMKFISIIHIRMSALVRNLLNTYLPLFCIHKEKSNCNLIDEWRVYDMLMMLLNERSKQSHGKNLNKV